MQRNADPNLSIRIDDDVAEVGSFFGCDVARSPADGESNASSGPGKIRAVRVSLRWYTEGRGDTDSNTVMTVELPVDEFGMTSGRVELGVPGNGPISYDGSLIRVRWEISAQTDIKLGFDQLSTAEVLVVPRGGHGLYDRAHPRRVQ